MPVTGRIGGPKGMPIIEVTPEELPDPAKFPGRGNAARKKPGGRSNDARRIENKAQRVQAKKDRMTELDEAYLIKKAEFEEEIADHIENGPLQENQNRQHVDLLQRQLDHLDRNLVLVKHRINQRDNPKDIDNEQLWFMASDE